MHNIAIAAAGTGGHIFPGLALANELHDQIDDVKIVFIGSRDGIENEIIPKYGYQCLQTDVQKLYRSFTLKNVMFPVHTIKSILETKSLYRAHKTTSFIGCGGFVTGTAGYAAKLCGIPIFLQEQNSYPGLSTRLIAQHAQRIYLGNDSARIYLKKYDEKCIYTGNPVRNYTKLTKQKALEELGLKDKFTIFIYGGSQGSKAINNAVTEITVELLRNDMQIVFQTGARAFEDIKSKFSGVDNIIVKPFIDRMDLVYSASDLVVCRAGAISLSEVSYFGIPAIIIPFPWAAGDHQLKNAMSYENNNSAVVIEEKDLTPELLFEKIIALTNNHNRLMEMQTAMKSLAKPEATKSIISDILQNLGCKC